MRIVDVENTSATDEIIRRSDLDTLTQRVSADEVTLASRAADSAVLHLAGAAETVTVRKTFSGGATIGTQLTLGGGLALSEIVRTASTSPASTSGVIEPIDASTGSVVLTLTPTASWSAGQLLVVKRIDNVPGNSVTITPAAGQTIDGSVISISLPNQYDTIWLEASNTAGAWRILARYPYASTAYVDRGDAISAPTGTVVMYAGLSAPAGWLLCDGSTYDGTTAAYGPLWSVIANFYGGTTQSAFKVPDMRDRTVLGTSATKALASQGGTLDGAHTHTDAHTHTLSAHTHTFSDGGHVHGSSTLKAEITVTTGGVKVNRVATTSWTSNSEANSVSNTSGGNAFSTGAPIDGSTDSATASGTTAGPSTANTSARSAASTGAPNSAGTNPGLPGYTSMNYIIKL